MRAEVTPSSVFTPLAGALGDEPAEAPAPPPARAALLVPVSARAYVGLDLRRERIAPLAAARRRLPALEATLLAELDERRARVRAPDPLALLGAAPWAGREAALAVLGTGGRRRDWVALVETRDAAAARQALALVAGEGRPAFHLGVSVRVAGRVAHAVVKGFALVGSEGGVRAAIDTARGAVPALARDTDFRALVAGLPPERVATAYASAAGLRDWLRWPATALAALSGATELRAAAVGLTLAGGRHGRVSLRALPLRPVCDAAGRGADELIRAAPDTTAAFVGVSRPACAARALDALDAAPGSLPARILRAAERVRVDLRRDALPLADDGAALVVTGDPSAGGALTLLAHRLDRGRALDVLGLLVPAVADALRPVAQGSAPRFGTREVGGVQVLSAAVSPSLELSYGAKEDRVAVSTQAAAVPVVLERSGLKADEQRGTGLASRPPNAAALVFLDLDQLLALAEQTGVAAGGAQLAARDDLQRLGPIGAVAWREGKTTTAELLFQNP